MENRYRIIPVSAGCNMFPNSLAGSLSHFTLTVEHQICYTANCKRDIFSSWRRPCWGRAPEGFQGSGGWGWPEQPEGSEPACWARCCSSPQLRPRPSRTQPPSHQQVGWAAIETNKRKPLEIWIERQWKDPARYKWLSDDVIVAIMEVAEWMHFVQTITGWNLQ